MQLVDTHCHLDQEEFDSDREGVIQRAAADGVETIICVGVTLPSSQACIELARSHARLRAAVGIHPNYCGEVPPTDWDAIVQLSSDPAVVALGETGLDFYRDYAPEQTQRDYFDRHLRLSQQTGLPFIVHTRASESQVMEMLREAAARAPLRGVMHSFTGSVEMAAECLELGMYISFAGMVTFKKSDELRQVATSIPADRLLVETDSPYLSPHPLRGQRNEPRNVLHTAHCLAAARGISTAELAALTTSNARTLFRLT